MQTLKEEIPSLEEERIKILKKHEILDTPPDDSFDKFTELTSELLDMPIAIVSLVDTDRIWFKSKYGLDDVQEIGRDQGLCSSAILSDDLYLVEDAEKDARSLSNPLVTGAFGLRFYAAVPLRTKEGYNLGTFCVMDKKPRRFSKDKKSILEKLARLVMEQMELRLEARMAIKHQHQMLDVTAHDLKNPLSIMPLMADMILKQKNDPAAIETMATKMKAASKQMATTITDILDSGSEDVGKVQLRLREVDLEELVRNVLNSNHSNAEKKNQQLHLIIDKGCIVFADHQKLTEVVDSLVGTAVKYSPKDKGIKVFIAMEEFKASIRIRIQDEASGFSADDTKNLFRKFISPSARSTEGEDSAGPGLSVVKDIVEAHNGIVFAESAISGTDTCFVVELPVSQN